MDDNLNLTTAMLEYWARMCCVAANAFGPDASFCASSDGNIRVSIRYQNSLDAKTLTKRFREDAVYSRVYDMISNSFEMQGSYLRRNYDKSIIAEQKLVLAQNNFAMTGIDDGSILSRQSELCDIYEKGKKCENRIAILHGARFINAYFRIGLVTFDDATSSYILNTKQIGAAAQRAQ